jgi:hypothetical protein
VRRHQRFDESHIGLAATLDRRATNVLGPRSRIASRAAGT